MALRTERQSARMSKIKNSGLDQYGAESFEQQQFGTAGVEGVNVYRCFCISCALPTELLTLCSRCTTRPTGLARQLSYCVRTSLVIRYFISVSITKLHEYPGWTKCCPISHTSFYYRASIYASAVLGVVILSIYMSVCLSVRPSVCHTRGL